MNSGKESGSKFGKAPMKFYPWLAHHSPKATNHCLYPVIGGFQIPVCSRCAGHLAGYIIGLPLMFILAIPFSFEMELLLWAVGLSCILQWAYASVFGNRQGALIRLAAGLAGGWVLAAMSYYQLVLMGWIAIGLVIGLTLIREKVIRPKKKIRLIYQPDIFP